MKFKSVKTDGKWTVEMIENAFFNMPILLAVLGSKAAADRLVTRLRDGSEVPPRNTMGL